MLSSYNLKENKIRPQCLERKVPVKSRVDSLSRYRTCVSRWLRVRWSPGRFL